MSINDTGDKFFAGVVDTAEQFFEKIQNGPNGILGGLGDTDSWKKPEVENLPLKALWKTYKEAWLIQSSLEGYNADTLYCTTQSYLDGLYLIAGFHTSKFFKG